MRRTLLICAGFLGACQEAPTQLLLSVPVTDVGTAARDAGVPDFGSRPDLGFRDLGTPDMGEVGPPDLGPGDLGPTGRRLVQWSPLGQTPANNLVMTPFFDPLSALAPFVDGGRVQRFFWRQTPTMMPVLRVRRNRTALIPAQSVPGPLDASIWVGTSGAANTEVRLVGLGLNQVDLEALLPPTGESMTIDGIEWRRHAGIVQEAFLGQIFILVNGNQETFLNGPVVVSAVQNLRAGGRSSQTLITAAPLSEHLAPVLQRVRVAMLDRAKRSLRPLRTLKLR